MTTYLTQEQAVALARAQKIGAATSSNGMYFVAYCDDLAKLCNAAIQHYRDSLVDGVVLPELPESDWLLHMPARPYESKWTSNQTGYEACQMENYARQVIADALAKRESGEPVAWFDKDFNNLRWRAGIVNADFEDGQPFYTHPVDALAKQVPQLQHGWRQEDSLLYRLTDDKRPQNHDEINVTMADGSRSIEARTRRAEELLDRLAAESSQQVPQGYKLVPVEPTNEMCVAADAYVCETSQTPKGMWWWGKVYSAMLAAAPDPKEQK